MKKNIWILIIMLIFMTGCTAEYNLKIDDVTYKESLLIAATTNNEVSNLNQEWQIPVNKDNYCLGDEDTDYSSLGDIYNYKFNNNRLTFSHDFQRGDYANSTIVSECYKTLTVTTYEKKSIISTSNTANCFDAYPELTSVIVNITVDGNVVSSNADSVSSNKYTWKLNKNNAQDKSINLVYESSNNSGNNSDLQPDETVTQKKDYTMYIFAGILLIVMLLAYVIFTNIKNNSDNMDD